MHYTKVNLDLIQPRMDPSELLRCGTAKRRALYASLREVKKTAGQKKARSAARVRVKEMLQQSAGASTGFSFSAPSTNNVEHVFMVRYGSTA